MNHQIDLHAVAPKKIFSLGENFSGENGAGESLSFTNYYMQKNGVPFFGISGEFHFSRMADFRWEDELIKMKMAGINMISTYVLWIHHEEEEGHFDFSGRRDLRKFVKLCQKHQLYVILRVGPFAHGEVRNGGFPDWLYGKPFQSRQLNAGFLQCTSRLYSRIAKEVEDLFYQTGGPIIGVQIDNEYMHSSAPWEMTSGVSNEWIFGGDEGDQYMLRLKELAAECGLQPVFYTCTGWGGAATPDSMLPLWGGYSYRPWLFYADRGAHPCTEEYLYQDFHNNQAVCNCNYDFHPNYSPEQKPYACCEMGGGMMCSYYYRFILPFESIDAMANIKLASGCNFLGYYMFQGGSNPVGKHGTFMNEGQVSKISYDYQAPLGEFGQVRTSYRRLKNIHFFTESFAERLCDLKTVLPENASEISPEDLNSIRFAVRTDGKQGFLFWNNFQDHAQMPNRQGESFSLQLKEETIHFSDLSLAQDENCILPFHFDLNGIDLIYASAQPLAKVRKSQKNLYLFFVPKGMQGHFQFQTGTKINGIEQCEYHCKDNITAEQFTVFANGNTAEVLCLSREFADRLFLCREGNLIFCEAAILEDDCGIRLETTQNIKLWTFPENLLEHCPTVQKISDLECDGIFGCYQTIIPEETIEVSAEQTAKGRYILSITPLQKPTQWLKDARLQIRYQGDIGQLFLNSRLIHDHFCNGDVWEFGLKEYQQELQQQKLTLYITPLRQDAKVNVESPMAGRIEQVTDAIAELQSVKIQPVYEILLEHYSTKNVQSRNIN